jgi:hypothetical protein
MKFYDLVNEIYDRNVNKTYPASSASPRKDFAPISTRDGYHHPYQSGATTDMESPAVEQPISYPWPLQTASEDMATAAFNIINVMQKISDCGNVPVLNINQKQELNKIHKYLEKIVIATKKAAFKIDEISDLALKASPEIKMNSSQNNNPNYFKNTEVVIKLPNKIDKK